MYKTDWRNSYEKEIKRNGVAAFRPVIAITGNYGEKGCELAEGYYRSIMEAGGLPLVIPPLTSTEEIENLLERVDGLLLSGGGDVNPIIISEEPVPALHSICPQRDAYELQLIRMAYDRQIPMLGICRGIQLLALALDGSIYQDLATQKVSDQGLVKHSQDLERSYPSHSVKVDKDSLLANVLGTEELCVNSFHHQAVKEAGPHLKVTAIAPDGVVEALESTEMKSIIGVQWHPECFVLRGDREMMPLFDWLAREASSFSAARSLQNKVLTLDSHCDTPMFFNQDIHFEERDSHILVDSHKMREGHLDASIMVAYLPQGELTDEGHAAAHKMADDIYNRIEGMVAHCSGVELASTPDELYHLKQKGVKAIMRGVENGYAIGKNLSLIEHFRRRGAVYMTLCHNGDNDICDSARGSATHGGVSDFGKQVIAEMNRVGLMVDLSHAAETSFYDALHLSRTPIVCSHSSSRTLCDHPRNLTDDQLRALAEIGGVAQVTLYHGFLKKEGDATLDDAVNHLLYMIKIAGIDHVGIGTDFDGDGGILGCASASELINFTRRLMAEGLTDADMEKIWGGNFLRVMRQVQSQGCVLL